MSKHKIMEIKKEDWEIMRENYLKRHPEKRQFFEKKYDPKKDFSFLN